MRRWQATWAAGLAVVLFAGTVAAEESPAGTAVRPLTALVLSGGGARGGAHLGVLQVLERERIPIDLIVGTSAGAIVGSLYASGLSPEYIQKRVYEIDWEDLMVDRPPRRSLPFRRKQDDLLGFARVELGVNKQGIQLPSGVQAGQKFGLLLRSLLLHTFGARHFDDLPIPFRAVATSLETGNQVVFEDGELATAVRASMSIPLLFAPVTVDGETLVDGGLVNNLPIDLALELGAERIIAVDISTPLGEPGDKQSMFSVGGRSLKVLTRQSVEDARAHLREGDIYLRPELEGVSSTDFGSFGAAIPLGREAAEERLEELRVLSVDEQTYRRYMEGRRIDDPSVLDTHIDQVVISGAQRVNPRLILARIRTHPGRKLDLETLLNDLERVYELGDFEAVRFHMETVAGQNQLVIEVQEKSWGPGFLHFGLALQSNVSGQGTFQTLAQYNRTQLNSRAAEWKTLVAIGDGDSLTTEFYQPLGYGGFLFVAPRAGWLQTKSDLFLDNGGALSLEAEGWELGFDLGIQLRNYGELRLGAVRSSFDFDDPTGLIQELDIAPESRIERFSYLGRATFDLVDSPFFPRTGWFLDSELLLARELAGADANSNFDRLERPRSRR